jgi:hypothetical protein
MSTVLSKTELIASLQNEVRILLHLAGKLTPEQLDYRPSPKQRSAIELLRYLTMMGPQLVPAIKTAVFDVPAWNAAQAEANASDADRVLSVLATQADTYAQLIGAFSEAELRAEIDMFGQKASRGYFIVNFVLSGHAAYRTQLFLYLKACGHHDLGTLNLWAGVDAPPPA